ncbi:MAG: hypothetical protein P1V97_27215 [Planctomycetota bacterium]|nr:hypothetical protein [Planctomycetota bacterium]
MFQRLSLLLVFTLAVLSQACRSIPDSESAGSRDSIDRPSLLGERIDAIPEEITDDFGLLSKSETPISKTAFWVGAGIGALPLIPLSAPFEGRTDLDAEMLYAPSITTGLIVGSALAAPLYLIEKPSVKVGKALKKKSAAPRS